MSLPKLPPIYDTPRARAVLADSAVSVARIPYDGAKKKYKGLRAFGDDFVRALHADFVEHGEQAIRTIREKKPADYVRVCAMLVPRQLEITTNNFDGMPVDAMRSKLAEALGQLAARGVVIDAVASHGSTRSSGSEQTGDIHSIPETTDVP